jgi:hypothetical protein
MVAYAITAILIGVAVFFNTGPDDKPGAKPPVKRKVVTQNGTDIDLSLLEAPPFEKPTIPPRDIFMPSLAAMQGPDGAPPPSGLEKVPAADAGGDSNWVYTGFAAFGGAHYALLENATSHQSGFVKEGDTWKKSKIVSIRADSVAFVGPDGTEDTVLRYDANSKTSGAKGQVADGEGDQVAPVQPMPPGMNGPIGRRGGGGPPMGAPMPVPDGGTVIVQGG